MYSRPACFAVRACGIAALLFALAACNNAPSPDDGPDINNMPMTKPPLDQAVTAPMEDLARADLARRLGLASERIEVLSAQAVTWADGSIGCPEPGGNYTQALVEGFQIVLAADGEEYHYHAAHNGEPFLCPQERRRAPIGAGTARY